MWTTLRMLFAGGLIVATSCSVAQERRRPPDPDLMARLSYHSSMVVRDGNVRRVCIAVSHDGEYRIMRSLNNGPTQRLHGKMPKEEFSQLSKLLGAAEFRKLSGYHGGLVRQESETFAAEIPAGDQAHDDGSSEWPEHEEWRSQWLNGDGENPFPVPVARVVDWLQRFQPNDGKAFDYAEYPDVCPSTGLRLLQPSVAENSQP